MLKIELAALLLGQLLMLAGCDTAPSPAALDTKPSPFGSAVELPPLNANQQAIAGISSKPIDVSAFREALLEEPRVIDFVYDPDAAFQWTIGVKADGSPRYGFAEYLCQRLGKEGLPVAETMIRIVDYEEYMAPGGTGRDASLGSVRCSDGQRITP